MGLTVATAIFGPGYRLYEPAESWPGCEFICFTDRDFVSKRWRIVKQAHGLTPRRSNRRTKALLHRYVEGTTLYVDSEFEIVKDPTEIVETALAENCWGAARHPQRDCIFDEAEACLSKGVTQETDRLIAQIARYEQAGMPRHFGLWANGILARRGDADSNRLSEAWWCEIENGADRDQVSMPFVAWRLGLPPGPIEGNYTAMPWIARRKSAWKG